MFFLAEDIFRQVYTLGVERKCLVVATLCDHVKTARYELIKILFFYISQQLHFPWAVILYVDYRTHMNGGLRKCSISLCILSVVPHPR